MSWPNDTYLNRCENSQTIICNLSRISPPPHDQFPAYYSGHTAFTQWHIHFSTVRLYENAFSREKKNYASYFLQIHYIMTVVCVLFAREVYDCNLHICLAPRGAHIYSIKWPLMAFSRCGAQNGSKYSFTSETAYIAADFSSSFMMRILRTILWV